MNQNENTESNMTPDSKSDQNIEPQEIMIAPVFDGLAVATETQIESIPKVEEVLSNSTHIEKEIDHEFTTVTQEEIEGLEESSKNITDIIFEENTKQSEGSFADSIYEELTSEDVLDPKAEVLERINICNKKLTDLQEKQSTLNIQAEVLENEIEDYLGVLEDLDQWINERKRSFAWKLLEGLRNRESSLNNDENIVKEFSKTPINLNSNFAPETRKWILKSFLTNAGVTALLLLIFMYVRRNRNTFVDQIGNWSQNGLWGNLRNLLISFVSNANFGLLSLYLILISFFVLLGTLFSYSRKVSRHSREIEEEAARLREIIEAADHIRSSRERIDSLYPQVTQVLEVLAFALHEPFKIDSRYFEFSAQIPDTSEIPESLEFAAPTEESIDRVFETLVLKTLNEIQGIGWRQEFLNKTLQELGNAIGIGMNSIALREIEADQRRKGKRHVLLTMETTNKDRILKIIGDSLVPKFAEIVQETVLPTYQPEVKSLRPDPLAGLEIADGLGNDKNPQISKWEEKLTEAAGSGSPWSVINFSNEGQARGKHLEPAESIFIGSKQVVASVDPTVKVYGEVDPGTRPFEVSIRVDLSSWCKPGDLAIFEGLESSLSESTYEGLPRHDVDESPEDVIY